MKNVYILMVILLSFGGGVLIAKTHYENQPVLTHDEAMTMCEALGLVYDYEAEGTTPAEFCKPYWDEEPEAIQ